MHYTGVCQIEGEGEIVCRLKLSLTREVWLVIDGGTHWNPSLPLSSLAHAGVLKKVVAIWCFQLQTEVQGISKIVVTYTDDLPGKARIS